MVSARRSRPRLVATAIEEQVDLAARAAGPEQVLQLGFHRQDVLVREQADIGVEVAELRRLRAAGRRAATDGIDRRLGNHHPAGALVAEALLVLGRPALERLQERIDAQDGVWRLGHRRARGQVGRVEARRVGVDRDFEVGLARLHPDQPEAGPFGHQRVVGYDAVVDHVARAEILADVLQALPLVDGLDADLAGHGGDGQVAEQRRRRVLDRPRGDEEGGHGAFVVDHPVADDLVAFQPGRVVLWRARVAQGEHVVGRRRGVHVRVEQQTVAAAAPAQRGRDARALRHDPDPARCEAIVGQPALDEVSYGAFLAVGAVDVAQGEREVDHVLPLDAGEHGVEVHERSSWRSARGAGSIRRMADRERFWSSAERLQGSRRPRGATSQGGAVGLSLAPPL